MPNVEEPTEPKLAKDIGNPPPPPPNPVDIAPTAEIKAFRPRSISGPRLHMGRITEAVHQRNHWFADIPAGVSMETVMRTDYLAHHAQFLKPLDKIEAFCEDGSWEAMFRVMFVSVAEVKLSTIYSKQHDLGDAEQVQSDLHEIKWKGPAMKFAVVHKATGEVIQDHLYPKAEAMNYLRKHLTDLKG